MALAKFFRFPFGTSGDRAAVPDPVDVSGNVSYEQGYGPDYQRANTDPLSKDIERNKANQLQYDITLALREYQTNGTPDWITAAQNNGVAYPYPAYARVRGADGITYTSTTNANTNAPPHATWIADAIATPPQFDADLSAATTAFVQRALGNYQAVNAIGSPATLVAADAGKMLVLGGTAAATLPLGSTVISGTIFNFVSVIAGRTILAQGSDQIFTAISTVSGLTLNVGDTAFLTWNGAQWVLVGGTAQLPYSNSFAASANAPGWYRHPSGVIEQWGTTSVPGASTSVVVTLPTAWPAIYLAGVATDSGGTCFPAGVQANGLSQITLFAAPYIVNGGSINAKNTAAVISWRVTGR